ncbi:hypothetical protein [Butyrivibrio sp. INlla21]|uniref:hypothetical protein n=1 Tax=Butyrivibrio sp. INlla21 TaxID=1520811 RepID=UPI000B82DFDE|nr:hypothetical protein [Butyrivibrio sp. INlla21]
MGGDVVDDIDSAIGYKGDVYSGSMGIDAPDHYLCIVIGFLYLKIQFRNSDKKTEIWVFKDLSFF